MFLQCGDREIDAAIEVVGKANNDSLTHTLIDFLVGEKDGVPKDPNYIYRLYMALKKYEDAAKTALIIAKQEQEMGNYALARSVLYETIRQLEDGDVQVPMPLRAQFLQLHSYELAKIMVRRGDHSSAAHLFLRVAQNASKFPMHLVGILTATVIECKRAKLNASCYEHAVMLMSRYRKNIQPDEVRRTIEGIVRKKSAYTEDIPEEMSPCPISEQMIPHSLLECPTTRDALPMCIITGRHMLLHDWCFCPVTRFPALYSEYVKYVQQQVIRGTEGESGGGIALDPIQGKPVTVGDLKLATEDEAKAYIRKYNNVKDETKKSSVVAEEESGERSGGAGTTTAVEKTEEKPVARTATDNKGAEDQLNGGGGSGKNGKKSVHFL